MAKWPKVELPGDSKVEEVKETAPVIETIRGDEPAKPVVLMSGIDLHIHDRMKSQPRRFEDISVKEVDFKTEGQHRLQLSKDIETAMLKRNVTPRWLLKKKQAIDYALDVVGWTLVNKVYFPELSDHHFTANGSIEAGDSILAFMPIERAQIIRERPAKLSRERVNNIPAQDLDKWEQRSEHHYKPDAGSETSGDKPRGIVVQPDNDI